ncbi:MAG: hypothetical protein KGL39_57310, partial [Patescibacteria group bacterium]|nr:hypothetical protein [Patescibacteria group bacterium]
MPDNPLEVLTDKQRLKLALKVFQAYAETLTRALNIYRATPPAERFHASTARIRLISGPNRAGKAQPIDEPVLTPDGWRRIGDLRVGDVVIGGDGFPCVVRGVFPQGVKPVFRVTFGDGSWTRCCNEHLWKIRTASERYEGANKKWRVMSLGDIRSKWGDEPPPYYRPSIPTAIPWMPRRRVPISPYVLGLLIGDGCIQKQSISYSTSDGELLDAIRAELPSQLTVKKRSLHPKKTSYDYAISAVSRSVQKNPWLDALRGLDLLGKKAHEKFIPHDYLFSPRDVRLAVLQGLMDTDGTVNDRGHISFCTTSPELARDVLYLVRSLGGRACHGDWQRKAFVHKQQKRIGRPSLRISVNMGDTCPFRLGRKVARWNEARAKARKTPARVMHKIAEDGEAECVCIAVSSPDHTYVTRDCIVTHNTTGAMVELVRLFDGCDPYKKRKDRDLRMYSVGKDEKHLADPMLLKILWPGAFLCIIDEETGLLRAVRIDPNNPHQICAADMARRNEWKPAPALLTDRDVTVRWNKRGMGVPSKLEHKRNGSVWQWFTSKSDPRQGGEVDVFHCDEEVEKRGGKSWVVEGQMRTADRRGIQVYSFTPQAATPEYF